MLKILTPCLLPALILTLAQSLNAQTTITQWNFNSVPPDASNGTGSTNPSVGSGIMLNIGGTTASFASGTAGTGSSDPAPVDNTGWGITNMPAQGTNNKTAGIHFSASTLGHENILITFDVRHSNTSPRHMQFQYTTDVTAATPVWTDFSLNAATEGDTWFARSYNLSAIAELDNNPNAGFQVVSAFEPSTSLYAASSPASIYATTGNWRFDMVTISGTSTGGDVNPPVAQSFQFISSNTSFIKFNEAVTASSATNLANYIFNPALNITNAALSATNDTVFLTHDPFLNGQPYTLTVSGVQDLAINTMAPTPFAIVFNSSVSNLVITEIIHSLTTLR